MTDLFDFGGNPIEEAKPAPKPAPAPLPPPPPAPTPTPAVAADPAPIVPIARVEHPRGLVASFSCYCGCQSEVREPCPETIPCWGAGCKGMMHRWTPRHAPPPNSAEVWDGEKLVRGR